MRSLKQFFLANSHRVVSGCCSFLFLILLSFGTTTAQNTVTQTFNFTGGVQNFVVPPGVFSVEISALGAQGGNGNFDGTINSGGLGGQSTGTLAVTPGQNLTIFVGGQGATTGQPTLGGFNGGGNGNGNFGVGDIHAGGGGASDVRTGAATLMDRVIVAGGGGGGTAHCINTSGVGGGLIGGDGTNGPGGGATQAMGGAPNGSFGFGGNSANGGGGGGGYYGGGGGTNNGTCGGFGGAGGGGSSFIGGVTNGVTTAGVQTGNGQVTITFVTNDVCDNAIPVTCGETVTGSTTLATDTDAPDFCEGTCSPNTGNGVPEEGVWYSLAGTGETFTFTATGIGGFLPAFSVFSGNCGALTCVEGGGPNVTFNTTIGTDYFIYIDGFNFTIGDFSFDITCCDPPMAICSNANVILSATNPGMGTLTPAMIDGGSTGNCAGFALSITGQTAYTCADVGPGNQVVVTLVASDGSCDPANQSTCQATITTLDQTPPTAGCISPVVAELDQNGVATISVADVRDDATTTDNCGVLPGGQLTQDAFICGELGNNMVTLTVTDVNGLSGNCMATVMVEDNIDPVAVCQDITIQLDATGNGTILAADIDGGTSDNCSFTLFAAPTAFDCTDVGANVVVLTATDPAGNTDMCNAIVTIEDNVAPVANCQNIVIQLDDNGEVSIAPSDVDGGSTDACGPLTFEVNQEDFNCDNIGPNTVTLTVTDANGNSSTCEAIVTVQDNTPAVILCRPSVNTVNDPGVCGADVLLLPPLVIEENCSIGNVARVPAPGTIFPIGTTLVTWTLTDAGGNPTSCLQNVTINDTEAPVVECGQPFHAFLAHEDNDPPNNWNNCFFPSYLLDPIMVISDNCGELNLTITNDAPTNFPPGFYSVNYTFTDQSGNVGTCVQSVKVWDTTSPTLTSCPDDIEVEATTTDGANVSWALPTAIDNCPSHDIILVEDNGFEPGDFFELGDTDIQYNVYDEYGQFTECNFTISVVPVGALSLSLTCMDELDVSLQNATSWSTIGWNPPLMGTTCEQCDVLASDDFRFIGTLAGHQYYAQNAQQMTFAEAIAYAENIGAEIAVLEDKKEVPMIANEMEAGNYFIGLVDAEGTNEFAWINGEEYVLSDFGVEFENLTEKPAAVILNEEGEWEVVLIEEAVANFVFEKVCVELDIEIENEDDEPQIGDEDEEVLAESGTTAAVTYTAVDQCGNVSTCGFEVALVAEAVAYCEPMGIATDEENPYFIESFSLNGYTVESGDDNGYGDYTNENFLFEPGEILEMHTTFDGPNIDELPMYCRIWMDLNNDGDFYDEGELVMQGVDVGQAIGELTIPNLNQNVENTVMRVAISRLTFAEACGDFLNGEVEDYTISIVKPEESQAKNDESGLSNNGLGAEMFLYPNPAQDELFVRLSNMEAETATLRIFNSVGQLVATERVATTSAARVNVSAYTNGFYSVTAEADGEVRLTQKFVIEQR